MDKKDRICRNVKYGTGRTDAYAIFRGRDRKLPELIHCKYLKQKAYLNSAREIIGFTDSYEEGLAYLAVYAALKYE